MCTFNTDVNVSEEQINAMIAAAQANGTLVPPTGAGGGDGGDPNFNGAPGKDPTKPAGGGDKGMGPDPTDPYNGNGAPTAPTAPPLAPGQTTGNTGFDAAAYLKARPDVAVEYQQESTRDKKSIDNLHSMGIYTADQFAAWHAGQAKAGGAGTGTGTDVGDQSGAVGQGNDLVTSLTSGFNDTIKQLQQQTDAQIKALGTNNTALTGQIQQMQQGFAQSQQQLLDGMNKAAAQQSQAFASALKDMRDAGNSSGQAAKKPNYKRALDRNKELNGNGLSSTMLTGAMGVAPGSMTLGSTSLLGA